MKEAYEYVFPLVLMDAAETAATNVTVPDASAHAPINQFAHACRCATADSRQVVTHNVDTIYSQAWLDIAAEPVVCSDAQLRRTVAGSGRRRR